MVYLSASDWSGDSAIKALSIRAYVMHNSGAFSFVWTILLVSLNTGPIDAFNRAYHFNRYIRIDSFARSTSYENLHSIHHGYRLTHVSQSATDSPEFVDDGTSEVSLLKDFRSNELGIDAESQIFQNLTTQEVREVLELTLGPSHTEELNRKVEDAMQQEWDILVSQSLACFCCNLCICRFMYYVVINTTPYDSFSKETLPMLPPLPCLRSNLSSKSIWIC